MKPAAAKKRIDWQAVHTALAAHAARPIATTLSGVDADRLLAQRTTALASRGLSAKQVTTRLLVLRVGVERYAVPLDAAREVVEVAGIAGLPGARSSSILGILNWRGTFVAAFDLADLLGASRSQKPRRAVVLAGEGVPRAIAVDAVEEVKAIDITILQPAEHLARKSAPLFRGVTREGLIILNEAALLERLKADLEAA